MTNWHHDNPIMTTEAPVTMEELIAHLSLNGSDDVRRFDLRIDTTGRIWSRIGTGAVTHSDTMRDFDLDKGRVEDYYRNFFGAILRRWQGERP